MTPINRRWSINQRVRATSTVTESGDLPGDPAAAFPAADYIHAVKGDTGKVVHVDSWGFATVMFDRKKTATIVCDDEIQRMPDDDAGMRQLEELLSVE